MNIETVNNVIEQINKKLKMITVLHSGEYVFEVPYSAHLSAPFYASNQFSVSGSISTLPADSTLTYSKLEVIYKTLKYLVCAFLCDHLYFGPATGFGENPIIGTPESPQYKEHLDPEPLPIEEAFAEGVFSNRFLSHAECYSCKDPESINGFGAAEYRPNHIENPEYFNVEGSSHEWLPKKLQDLFKDVLIQDVPLVTINDRLDACFAGVLEILNQLNWLNSNVGNCLCITCIEEAAGHKKQDAGEDLDLNFAKQDILDRLSGVTRNENNQVVIPGEFYNDNESLNYINPLNKTCKPSEFEEIKELMIKRDSVPPHLSRFASDFDYGGVYTGLSVYHSWNRQAIGTIPSEEYGYSIICSDVESFVSETETLADYTYDVTTRYDEVFGTDVADGRAPGVVHGRAYVKYFVVYNRGLVPIVLEVYSTQRPSPYYSIGFTEHNNTLSTETNTYTLGGAPEKRTITDTIVNDQGYVYLTRTGYAMSCYDNHSKVYFKCGYCNGQGCNRCSGLRDVPLSPLFFNGLIEWEGKIWGYQNMFYIDESKTPRNIFYYQSTSDPHYERIEPNQIWKKTTYTLEPEARIILGEDTLPSIDEDLNLAKIAAGIYYSGKSGKTIATSYFMRIRPVID